MGLWRTVGYGGDSGSITDIAQAELVISIGSNTAESHPVLATRVKRAQKLHGQKVIVADLREHELANRADLFVRPAPGSDLIWLSAVTKYIIDQGWHDESFLRDHVNDVEEYFASLDKYTLDYAKQKRLQSFWAMGVTQHGPGPQQRTGSKRLWQHARSLTQDTSCSRPAQAWRRTAHS